MSAGGVVYDNDGPVDLTARAPRLAARLVALPAQATSTAVWSLDGGVAGAAIACGGVVVVVVVRAETDPLPRGCGSRLVPVTLRLRNKADHGHVWLSPKCFPFYNFPITEHSHIFT